MWLFWACAIYEWREADSRQVCGCLATRPSPSLRSPVDPEVAYPNIFPCANMLPNFLLDKLNFVSKICFVRFCSIFFYIIKVNSFCYKRQLGMIHFFGTLRYKYMKIMIYCSSVFKPLLVRRNPKQKYKQTCLCCRQSYSVLLEGLHYTGIYAQTAVVNILIAQIFIIFRRNRFVRE